MKFPLEFANLFSHVQEKWIQNGRGSGKGMQAKLWSRAHLFQEKLVE